VLYTVVRALRVYDKICEPESPEEGPTAPPTG
jgi:hypothetical protein